MFFNPPTPAAPLSASQPSRASASSAICVAHPSRPADIVTIQTAIPVIIIIIIIIIVVIIINKNVNKINHHHHHHHHHLRLTSLCPRLRCFPEMARLYVTRSCVSPHPSQIIIHTSTSPCEILSRSYPDHIGILSRAEPLYVSARCRRRLRRLTSGRVYGHVNLT